MALPHESNTMDTPPNKPAAPKKQRQTRLVFAAITLLIVAALAQRWWWNRSHVSTDNAQLEGRIVPIAARVGGYVLSVPVADNQATKAGDLLVEIDPRDFTARLSLAEAEYQEALSSAGKEGQPGIAQAQIAAAQANAAAASSQTHSIEAQIVEARANVDKTQRDYVRASDLAKQKMFSAAALDAAETALKSAEARVSALEAQLRSTRESASAVNQQVGVSAAGLKAAQAKVVAAQANVSLARNQLADTRVLSPADGVISKKAIEAGQMIQAGQTLMYLVQSETPWVVANLKETEVEQVKPGQKVEIDIDAYPGVRLAGHVDSFSSATGARFTLLPPDNSTGNFTKVVQRIPVKIVIDEVPEGIALSPGMSVNVVIATR